MCRHPYHSVGGPVTFHCQSSPLHGFDEAAISHQINFQDLHVHVAAELAKTNTKVLLLWNAITSNADWLCWYF